LSDLFLATLAGCGALVGYTYAGYPALLSALGRRGRPAPSASPLEWPFITVVIPAYNEGSSIGRTLTHILEADYPAERRQVLVISDASTDGTDDVVRSFETRGVELVRMEARGGKTRNENAVLPLIRGEVVVNTDAAMRIHPSAFKELVMALADPTVGVASGRDVSVSSGDAEPKSGEGAYVGYEMWVRDLETRAGGIIGASGCLYAIRTGLHRRPIRDDLSRDFASALTAREAGYRAVSVPGALCYVPHTDSLRQEYHRKVRTIARGLLTLASKAHLLHPLRYGAFAWMLYSHKLCRWLVPWAMLVSLIMIGALALTETWARWLATATAVVALAAVAGWLWPAHRRMPRFLALPAYAIAGNVAVIHAWLRALSGRRTPVWEPTRRPADQAAA
jgi:cellulose synthase/poly-beta-1,6-N-acetylglucosamine synthase-like glycosyltransferase